MTPALKREDFDVAIKRAEAAEARVAELEQKVKCGCPSWAQVAQAKAEGKREGLIEARSLLAAVWPHIELVMGHGSARRVSDPGIPACLRCNIEGVLDAAVRGV